MTDIGIDKDNNFNFFVHSCEFMTCEDVKYLIDKFSIAENMSELLKKSMVFACKSQNLDVVMYLDRRFLYDKLPGWSWNKIASCSYTINGDSDMSRWLFSKSLRDITSSNHCS